jgi:hypothetical protein
VVGNRNRLADTIANPSVSPEVFEEGWEEVLEREHGGAVATEVS